MSTLDEAIALYRARIIEHDIASVALTKAHEVAVAADKAQEEAWHAEETAARAVREAGSALKAAILAEVPRNSMGMTPEEAATKDSKLW